VTGKSFDSNSCPSWGRTRTLLIQRKEHLPTDTGENLSGIVEIAPVGASGHTIGHTTGHPCRLKPLLFAECERLEGER
jgi:hypothetical protein